MPHLSVSRSCRRVLVGHVSKCEEQKMSSGSERKTCAYPPFSPAKRSAGRIWTNPIECGVTSVWGRCKTLQPVAFGSRSTYHKRRFSEIDTGCWKREPWELGGEEQFLYPDWRLPVGCLFRLAVPALLIMNRRRLREKRTSNNKDDNRSQSRFLRELSALS